jgi:hypothetical protein
MTESIPTTWNDERDTAFFGITEKLAAGGFAEDTALLATAVFAVDDLAAQIEKMLQDIVAAESWETMARRSTTGSKPHHRDLVPVPIAAPRRAAS